MDEEKKTPETEALNLEQLEGAAGGAGPASPERKRKIASLDALEQFFGYLKVDLKKMKSLPQYTKFRAAQQIESLLDQMNCQCSFAVCWDFVEKYWDQV